MEPYRPALLLLWLVVVNCESSPGKHVAVVVFSGLSEDNLASPTLEKIAEKGAMASVRSVFPTESFPNQYSMLTGLSPVTHGVIWDRMLDESSNNIVNAANVVSDLLLQGELIWTTAHKENIRTGVFTSGKVESGGLLSAPCEKCNPEHIIDELVLWISSQTSDNAEASTLSFVVFPACEEAQFGTIAKHLMNKLEQEHLNSLVDVIFTGDHGLVKEHGRTAVCLQHILQGKSFEIIDETGGSVSLRPTGNDTEFMLLQELEKVKGIDVHPFTEFTRQFGLVGSSRIAPITIVASDDDHVIVSGKCQEGSPDVKSPRSRSGYTSLMARRTTLLGVGPRFAAGVRAPMLNITDIHQVICTLLNLNTGNCRHNTSKPSIDALLASTRSDLGGHSKSDISDGISVEENKPVVESGHRRITGVGVFFVILTGFGFVGGLFWLKNFLSDRRRHGPGYKPVNTDETMLSGRTQPLLGSGDDYGVDVPMSVISKDQTAFQLDDDDDDDDDDDRPPAEFSTYSY
ncbi:bis(5'-adenosyl)-triphosphatase enpp4-like [Sycon ciliatum]|uniref:bis(5'-adenosyl)-triphosphatase enpp4-like n=1 Tax=Sycon ciliatum TaxID=27933 RepID=UPI0020AAF4C5|eukprot:scpid46845/ scgid27419/ Ectonucleotide pyrophosphatase/phosphodiesterase family member 1; Membrane component chromosome 6 surface marker 1; Phosphodiesterase I/nucleotide pyrophosphatase 1; Plasma-cell membrane glycoprotein PC-1; Alkaline phosphodiesterase I; Nucleotide pyrophosphatase